MINEMFLHKFRQTANVGNISPRQRGRSKNNILLIKYNTFFLAVSDWNPPNSNHWPRFNFKMMELPCVSFTPFLPLWELLSLPVRLPVWSFVSQPLNTSQQTNISKTVNTGNLKKKKRNKLFLRFLIQDFLESENNPENSKNNVQHSILAFDNFQYCSF